MLEINVLINKAKGQRPIGQRIGIMSAAILCYYEQRSRVLKIIVSFNVKYLSR